MREPIRAARDFEFFPYFGLYLPKTELDVTVAKKPFREEVIRHETTV